MNFLSKIRAERLFDMAERYPYTSKDFAAVFDGSKPKIIAEVKLASPSLGLISDKKPIEVAETYLNNGAAAISVLTEPRYFKGSLDYLTEIRVKFSFSYLLQKDFFVNIAQIAEARLLGADCILLIVNMLDSAELLDFYQLTQHLGLSALVEVHSEKELARALKINAKLIGVNNRNLESLKIDSNIGRNLAKYTGEAIFIAESGFGSREQVQEFFKLGYKGFLIGSGLMKAENTAAKLKELINGF